MTARAFSRRPPFEQGDEAFDRARQPVEALLEDRLASALRPAAQHVGRWRRVRPRRYLQGTHFWFSSKAPGVHALRGLSFIAEAGRGDLHPALASPPPRSPRRPGQLRPQHVGRLDGRGRRAFLARHLGRDGRRHALQLELVPPDRFGDRGPAATPSMRALPPLSCRSPPATRPRGPGRPAAVKARVRTPCSTARTPAPAPGPDFASCWSRSFALASPALKPLSARKVRMTTSNAMLVTLLRAARVSGQQQDTGDRRPNHDGRREADGEHQHAADVAHHHARAPAAGGAEARAARGRPFRRTCGAPTGTRRAPSTRRGRSVRPDQR